MRVYGAETGEMICVPLQAEGLHSALSSFTYGQLGHAVGRWQTVQTGNVPIDRTITVGVENTTEVSVEN